MKVLTDNQHYQDIAEAILAKTGGTTPLKPAEMAPALNDLNIELEEAYVTPTSEPQEILPGEGFYGFSKIIVDGVEGGGDSGSGGDGGGTGGGDSGGDSGGGGDSSDLTPAEDESFGKEKYPYMAYYAPDGGLIDYAPAPIGEYFALYWVTNNAGVSGGEVTAHYVELWVSQTPLEARGYGLWPVSELETEGWVMSKYTCDLLAGETGWTHQYDIHKCIDPWDWVNHDISDSPGSAGTYGPYVWKVETEETYTVKGETVNALVSAAQTVTNSPDPMTPDEATTALEEYAADKWEGGSY